MARPTNANRSPSRARRLAGTVALAVGLALAPAAAYAVNVSSNDGNGTQRVIDPNAHGWVSTGQLRSASGNRVYYSGKVVYNGQPDTSCGRYTTNTTSTSYVVRGGECDPPDAPTTADAAEFRVCRDISGLPDPCGAWSLPDYL